MYEYDLFTDPFPSDVWLDLGSKITVSRSERCFRSHFGLSTDAVSLLWSRILSFHGLFSSWGAEELLHCLYFLKSPASSWSTNASRVGCTEKTFTKHLKESLRIIDNSLPEVKCNIYFVSLINIQFDFEDRWDKWSCKQPSAIIDTTLSAHILQPFESPWEYYDTYKKKYFVKYEAVCSIGSPRIIWWKGPFKATIHDCRISQCSELSDQLQPGERLLADKAYLHRYEDFICPVPDHATFSLNSEDRTRNYMIYSARQTVERIFARLKMFGFWTSPWRGSMGLHKLCASVTAKLVNLSLIFNPL